MLNISHTKDAFKKEYILWDTVNPNKLWKLPWEMA